MDATAERLVLDLGAGGAVAAGIVPADGGLPEEASRAAFGWPLNGDALEDLPAQVEAALAARNRQQRPDQYLDPVFLASLIVAIATLAWTIYNDQRKRTPDPPPSTIARQVRITLRDQDTALPPGTEHITEVVATEIIRQGGET